MLQECKVFLKGDQNNAFVTCLAKWSMQSATMA